MMNQQSAAPATAEEIAALRDALAKATPGEWATGKGERPFYASDTQIVGVNSDGDPFILASFNHNFDESAPNAVFSALSHNLAPKLLARLDEAVYDAKVQSQRADATMIELEKIHRLLGRGDGHGSLHATADCVICGIVTLKERVAEAEAESARLQEALDAAEAEIARLKAGGCARDQRTTQHCADAVAAEAKAVEFAWDMLGLSERDGELYDDCRDKLPRKAALFLESRGLLKRTGERIWQRVEGK